MINNVTVFTKNKSLNAMFLSLNTMFLHCRPETAAATPAEDEESDDDVSNITQIFYKKRNF